jgi:hypothetical protein
MMGADKRGRFICPLFAEAVRTPCFFVWDFVTAQTPAKILSAVACTAAEAAQAWQTWYDGAEAPVPLSFPRMRESKVWLITGFSGRFAPKLLLCVKRQFPSIAVPSIVSVQA